MASETSDTTLALDNLNGGHGHMRQKRARSQLSCVPCRSGKLKCNRSHDPACDQCIKRNRESTCIYVPPPVKQKPAQNVKGRIRQLESLVVDLMKQQQVNAHGSSKDARHTSSTHARPTPAESAHVGPVSHPTPPSDNDSSPPVSLPVQQTGSNAETGDDIESTTKPFGQMRISKGEFSYVGDAHWQAILHSIDDLKREVFDDVDEPPDADSDHAAEDPQADGRWQTNFTPPHCPLQAGTVPMGGVQPHASTGLGFMIGHSQSMSKDQLIAAVPDKKVADRLLSLWFNSPDPFKPIIHAPTFQEEYRQYWRNPRQMPTMWLGLLFSIMSLAASFGLRDIDPTSQQAKNILVEVNKYHSCAGAAAVLADFTKPRQYTIECLILYSAGLRSSNAFVNVWLMIGTVVRLCLRMGYHRDPGNYPAISTFHGEMRRRVWSIISMIDVLISFQLGLPSLVKTVQSDCQMPRNLLDRDFGVTTKVLPPSRDVDDLTPCSYIRSKLRIIRIFADATELSHATIPPAYEEMMELDRRLEEARSQIPPLLQMPDISEVVTDPAEQLMCRFNLDLLYLKTKTVLHRRYVDRPFEQLTPEEQRFGIGYSRKTCTDCALRVLRHHHTIYSCSQPGGQLESVKWYMGSISTHDFLLASMIICRELSSQITAEASASEPRITCPRRQDMLQALQCSQKIWSDASKFGRKKSSMFVGKDEINKAGHMFDETERASRAMAAMLERVKAHQEKHPPNYRPGARCDQAMPSPDKAPNTTSGPGVIADYLQNQTPAFGGIVSYHAWDNPTTGPDDVGDHAPRTSPLAGNTVPSLYDGNPFSHSTATASSANPSPDQSSSQQDVTMISDILDMQGPVDWGTWDDVVLKTNKQEWRAGGFSYDVDMSNPDDTPDGSLGRVTSTIAEATPPVSLVPQALAGSLSNPSVATGLGAMPAGDTNDYQPWMHSFEDLDSFDMDRLLGLSKPAESESEYWASGTIATTAAEQLPQQTPGLPSWQREAI